MCFQSSVYYRELRSALGVPYLAASYLVASLDYSVLYYTRVEWEMCLIRYRGGLGTCTVNINIIGVSRSENFLEKWDAENSGGGIDTDLSPEYRTYDTGRSKKKAAGFPPPNF